MLIRPLIVAEGEGAGFFGFWEEEGGGKGVGGGIAVEVEGSDVLVGDLVELDDGGVGLDDVAAALMGYLRHGRPQSVHRRLFLRVRVPWGPIQATAVTDAFAFWAARAARQKSTSA